MSYRHPDRAAKAGYVQAKFDEIARDYDLFNDLITQGQHRYWKRVLVNRLALRPDARGLDLCCGTGDIAARTLARLDERGALVAADFSLNMLRIARERLTPPGSASGGPGRAVMAADAMRLPYRDAAFDFITIGYGLRNVSDLRACLRELHRVLAPGGVLASLDIGKVRNPVLRPLAEFYLFRVVPVIGGLLQRRQDMFTYLPHSTRDYPAQDALRTMMEEAGFERVRVVEFLFGASVIHLAYRAGPTA